MPQDMQPQSSAQKIYSQHNAEHLQLQTLNVKAFVQPPWRTTPTFWQ